MTTSVKIHVNGRYRATVRQKGHDPVVVDGAYDGSPNPSGEATIWLGHPAKGAFEITEEYLDAKPTIPFAPEGDFVTRLNDWCTEQELDGKADTLIVTREEFKHLKRSGSIDYLPCDDKLYFGGHRVSVLGSVLAI